MTPLLISVSSETIQMNPLVAVVMGSDSDLPTMKPALDVLNSFGVQVEVRILSAHRTPNEMVHYGTQAEMRGLKVIIAGAGGAAHLPGMLASLTSLPVIGVPVKSKSLSGVDSMLSILQMPRGIPVATVAIGGGLNAGLLAVQILAAFNSSLADSLATYRKSIHDQVIDKDRTLTDLGVDRYLEQM